MATVNPPSESGDSAGSTTNTTEVTAQTSTLVEIAALKNLKIPPFWKVNPALWFVQIEAQFHNNRISSDNSKFNAIIAGLDPEILNEVSDLVLKPPVTNKYLAFKTQLMARFTESKERQLNRLMTSLELGDKRPSSLLREMRRLAGENVPDEMLSTIWMTRMPNHVRGILSASRNIDLTALSEIADKIIDNMSAEPSSVFAAEVNECKTNTALEQRLTNIESSISSLTAVVRDLKTGQNKSRMQSRSRSNARTRGPSPKETGMCFFHKKFGAEARRCDKPCSFISKKLDKLLSTKAVDNRSNLNRECRLFIFDKETHQKFLLDSGSTICVLPRSRDCQNPKGETTLLAANNSPINTYGQKVLTLNLGLRRALTWPFIIADVKTAIIGADLLVHYGLVIDLKSRRVIDKITSLTVPGEIDSTNTSKLLTISGPEPYINLVNGFLASSKTNKAKTSKPETNTVQHCIITTGQPVAERPRRLSGEKLKQAKADFDEFIKKGFCRPSSSPWASPIHLVQKKTGGWRCCGDYRRLNAKTQPDSYPIPHIMDFTEQLNNKSWFSILDLDKAYYQIPMAPEDVQKTAVTTPFGLFEFLVMPFGLKNATQTFQRFMDTVLRGLDFAFCYIDDVLIASDSEEQHQQHVRRVLQRLQEHGLILNLKKCIFGKPQVTYLGHAISKNGCSPPEDRIEAISNYPKPSVIVELRRFLGIVNYYRRYIPNCAHIQAPMNELVKDSRKNDKRPVSWTSAAEKAFQACKDSVKKAVLLTHLDSNAKLFLTTDASDVAVGAKLEQLVNNQFQPIGLFSCKLSKPQSRYSTYDRELLAIYLAVRFFKHILDGRQFTIQTDHKPLIYAFQQLSDKAPQRRLRHLDYISQFTTDIKHLPGEDNTVADALSRIYAITTPVQFDLRELHLSQLLDPELQELLKNDSALKLNKLTLEPDVKIYCDIAHSTIRPYIPAPLRRKAFASVHELAHPSGRTTSLQLRQKYVWPNIKKDALEWSRTCIQCQRSKIQTHTHPTIESIKVPEQRFQHVHIDIIILPLCKGHRYCLTMIDRFSRWPEAIPIQDITAETVANSFYTHWVARFGSPEQLTTDQGTQFESTLFNALTNMCGTIRIRTSPYHPASNGLVERWHRSLKAALMCHERTNWVDALPTVLLGLRTAYKEDIKASAAEMLYGKNLRVPGEFFTSNESFSNPQIFIEQHRETMRKLLPTRTSNHANNKVFVPSDLLTCSHVFLRCDAVKKPLQQPYTGPHPVLKRISNKLFTINTNGRKINVSIERLKPAHILAENVASIQHKTSHHDIHSKTRPKFKVKFNFPTIS